MRTWNHFRTAKDGLAAVEFALILPVMIGLFYGTVEITMALTCRDDVSIMTSTAADLIAQESSVQSTDLSNVYNAAGTILYPYYDPSKDPVTAGPTIRITSVIYDTTSKSVTSGKIAWTCTQPGSGTLTPAIRSKGDTVTFNDSSGQAVTFKDASGNNVGIMVANGSVIMAEVAYSYSSPTTKFIAPNFNMTNFWYTKPRRVAQIPAPSPAPSGCTT
jgi:Flp pilus assembly protein TadG